MFDLLFASMIFSQSPHYPPVKKVVIVVGESNNQIKEREERERRPTIPSPGFASSSEAKIIGDSTEQCVIYAKRVTGITKSIGYAGTAQVEGNDPQVGAIALERRYGHAMVVVAVADTGVTIHEANFVRGHITERFIPYSDIRGYIYR